MNREQLDDVFKRVPSPIAPEAGDLINMLVESALDTIGILDSTDGDSVDKRAALRWAENMTRNGDETAVAGVAWELANAVAFHAIVEKVPFFPQEPALRCPCPIDHVRQAIAFNDFLDAARARDNQRALKCFMREAAQPDGESSDPAENRLGLLAGYMYDIAHTLFIHRATPKDAEPPVAGM